MLDHWTWRNRALRRPSPWAMRPATSTSKPRTCDGLAGSASTNGAPPSASPPHTSSCAFLPCAASVVATHSARTAIMPGWKATSVWRRRPRPERRAERGAEVDQSAWPGPALECHRQTIRPRDDFAGLVPERYYAAEIADLGGMGPGVVDIRGAS